MKTYINFNNYNSLYDLDLVIVDMENIPVANEVVEYENGYTIRTGQYENIELPITFRSIKAKSIIEKQFDVIDWLTNIKDNKLTFSFMNDKYYVVKNIKIENITRNFNRYNTVETIFILEPFKYEHEWVINILESTNLFYKGTVQGECNIKIYGSGNIQLTINDETVQINNVEDYVELDSKLLLCLNLDKTSKTRDMIGHFPLLTRGENHISWTGNVSKVEILPRTAFR